MTQTAVRLAGVLEAEGLPVLAARVREHFYDDYFSEKLDFPILRLQGDLRLARRPDLAARAHAGEWDGTRADAEEWLSSEPVRALLSSLRRR